MGNPFAHIELNTGDLKGAKSFYKKLFDWKLEDMPMGDGAVYTMVDVGKGVGGGMQVKPMADAPTQWISYVEVDDVNKTIAKAQKLGANIIVPHMDIGPSGAIGIFVDPTGAMPGVWAQAKKVAKAAKKSKPAAKAAAKTAAKKPAKKSKKN